MSREKTIIVADTNIIINIIFSPSSGSSSLMKYFLLHGYQIIIPSLMLTELMKYREIFLSRKDVDIAPLVQRLLGEFRIVDRHTYQHEYQDIALIMQDIDPKDTDFVACAMHYDCPLRTNDKKLKQHINRITILDTQDLTQTYR